MPERCSKLQYYCLVKHATHATVLNPCHNKNIAVLSIFARDKIIEKNYGKIENGLLHGIQVLLVLERKNKLTKKQSATLFLFWQRCGTVTQCVYILYQTNVEKIKKHVKIIYNSAAHPP